nr:hypothetical protein [Duganella qianjiadongensis]
MFFFVMVFVKRIWLS